MSFLNNNNSSSRPQPRNLLDDKAPKYEPAYDSDSSDADRTYDSASSPFAADNRASFGTASGPTPPDKCTNVVGAGTKWHGTLMVDDSVRIEGTFEGEVEAKGTVHVAQGAHVDANIRAAFVVVAGDFKGEIRCDQRCDLLPRSRVTGEVITKVLSIQEGATLDGRVQMSGDPDTRRVGRASRASADEASRSESPIASGAKSSSSNGA
jgi:cytoskeletal protein CcmA (bactofilin family)